MLEIIAFAGELSDRGDCYRAATEFKRFAFLMSDDRARWWAQMKIGECYFGRSDWKEAALEYGEAAVAGHSVGERNLALHLAAASHFDAGSYTRALRELVGLRPEDPADSARADFARGMCRLALGEWEGSEGLFRGIVRMAPEPPLGAAAAFLARKAQEGPDLPRKNATLAASLSAVVPGSGQVYAGRTYDGLRHFIFDGLLIYTVYWLFSEENYTGGYLLAAFTLPFYAGNIAGAGRSASQYNESRRLESVSRWIDEAGSR